MKFNNTTIILIIILLLILYLLDNIKEIEDNILKQSSINKKHLHPRNKYFQDIFYDNIQQKKEKIKKNMEVNDGKIVKELSIKQDGNKIDVNISLEDYSPPVEESVDIPSVDKHISGVSGPGITTSNVIINHTDEKPLYINY